MKKIITSALAFLFITSLSAQEKGDVFLGINFGSVKVDSENSVTNNNYKDQSIGLNFSKFMATNRRLNINFSLIYSDSKNTTNNVILNETETNGFNFGLGYGILYPLFKNFYAEATPNFYYGRIKGETNDIDNLTNPTNSTRTANNYGLGVNGGLLWVPFKHFGLSTSLLSLNTGFTKIKDTSKNNNSYSELSASGFNFNNSGSLNNQAFTIFYKF